MTSGTIVFRVWFVLLLLVAAGTAAAHRPGESYVYIDVNDSELSGEFHIRVEDISKAIDLDADRDGAVTDAEVEIREADILDHLSQRLFFFAEGDEHRIEPRELSFFGDPKVRQMVVEFDVPSLKAVPDVIEVEYRFLYDGADAAHRPMLLQNSNTRMRLHENEWFVSLVFEPGAERQSLSLVPPPRAPLFAEFVLQGVYMMLGDLDRLLLISALLLPVVVRRQNGAWRAQGDAADIVRSVATIALALAVGMAVALQIRMHFDVGPTPPFDYGLLALSVALVAVDNFRPIPWLQRWQVALVAGVLQGAGSNAYVGLAGLNKALVEVVLGGFAIGVMLSVVVVAAVLVPILVLIRDMPLYRVAALRIGSVLLVGVSAAWFTTKVL